MGYETQFSEFNRLLQLQEFIAWVNSKNDDPRNATMTIAEVRGVWENVWKKPLDSLSEQDIVAALNWVKETNRNWLGAVIQLLLLVNVQLEQPRKHFQMTSIEV